MDYKQIIEKNFCMKIKEILLLDSHFGTEIYHVISDNNEYILKVLPSSSAGAKNEGYITEFLINNSDIKVPKFEKTNKGEYYFIVNDRIITVQEYLKGETIQINTAPNWFILESARMLSKINSVLSNYENLPLQFGEDFFIKSNVINKINQFKKELLTVKQNDNKLLVLAYEEQIKHLTKISKFNIDTNKLTYGNSHGDFHIGQTIIQKEKIAVIDWTSACKLPVCLEIITFFVFSNPKCKEGFIDYNDLKQYISIYCENYKLNESDIKIMPYVFYFWNCMCHYLPQEDITENYVNIDQLIKKVLNWLYDHVEILSEKLL